MADTAPVLTRDEMTAISRLVYDQIGIRLTDAKMGLVNARLQKRLRAGRFTSYAPYLKLVRKDTTGPEFAAMLDALTTNKTSFFREPEHFTYLTDQILPEVLAKGARTIAGWSAGCATGEEPYSMVMALLDALQGRGGCDIDLVASDVSNTALAKATQGVYSLEDVQHVEPETLRRYFERGVGQQEGLARVRGAVRRFVRFERANLLEPRRLPIKRDFIWCRNTLMYFDRPARQRVIAALTDNLTPTGYLFVSHAENLTGLDHALERVGPAVYRRKS